MNALLIHGFMGCGEDFDPLISHLNFPCHTMKLPAMFTLDGMVDAIEDTIRSKELSPCVLIGYSMGGRLAMLLANRSPHLLSHLIVLSANPGIEDLEKRQLADQRWAQCLQVEGIDPFLSKWYEQPLFAPLKAQTTVFEAMIKRRKAQNAETLAKIIVHLSVTKQPSLWGNIPFSLPNLYLFGEKDWKYLPIFNRLRGLKKLTTTHTVSNSGHALHLENPEGCAREIHTFITKGHQ